MEALDGQLPLHQLVGQADLQVLLHLAGEEELRVLQQLVGEQEPLRLERPVPCGRHNGERLEVLLLMGVQWD